MVWVLSSWVFAPDPGFMMFWLSPSRRVCHFATITPPFGVTAYLDVCNPYLGVFISVSAVGVGVRNVKWGTRRAFAYVYMPRNFVALYEDSDTLFTHLNNGVINIVGGLYFREKHAGSSAKHLILRCLNSFVFPGSLL